MVSKIKKIYSFLTILFSLMLLAFLQGCASSCPTRVAANSIDQAYLGITSDQSEFDVTNTYQNTSQKTKGVLIGGIAGGTIGAFANGVGVVPGVATGAILGGALGAYIDSRSNLVDKLTNRNVKVVVLGDQVLIVIPSTILFNELTSNLHASATSTLDMVGKLIGNYINMSVKVTAYTGDTGNKELDCALSQQQAERVAKYLWKHCINTRLLYAEGMGGKHLVTCNSAGWCSENYRVEITFEKLPGCC